MLNMFARSFSTIWWGLGRAAGLPCRGNLQVTFFEKPIFSSPIGKRLQKIKWDILRRNSKAIMYLSLFTCKLDGYCTLHCKEMWIYVFPEKELRGLSPNFHIHESLSNLHIPTFGPPMYFPYAAELADRSAEYINHPQKHECRNWDCSRAVPFPGNICFECSALFLCSMVIRPCCVVLAKSKTK